ncbi:MAG: DUF1153 domain-containing protein [Halocynthiibacter sp.]
MYLKKITTTRTAKLPNGDVMSVSDLPPRETVRWVASRKAAVVKGIALALISKEDAMERYGLCEEELDAWIHYGGTYGQKGLKSTKVQQYRQK